MNKERMLLLADLLDTIQPQQFNIQYWTSDYDEDSGDHFCQDMVDLSAYKCNTAACIAGWAVALENDLEVVDCNINTIEDRAVNYLDLTDEQRHRLFYYSSLSIWAEHAYEVGLGEDSADDLSSKGAAYGLRKIVSGEWEL